MRNYYFCIKGKKIGNLAEPVIDGDFTCYTARDGFLLFLLPSAHLGIDRNFEDIFRYHVGIGFSLLFWEIRICFHLYKNNKT